MDFLNAHLNILGNFDFILVDIGGKNGLIEPWKNVKDIITSVIFEPQDETYNNKNIHNNRRRRGRIINIPEVVGKKNEKRNFYKTRNSSYSSLLKPNYSQLEGTYYYEKNFYKLEKIEEVNTNSLHFYLNKENIQKFDFLKIDIQGAETFVLNNMEDKWEDLLGLYTEAYAANLYQEGNNIADILNILYSKDMEIFDFKTIAYSTFVSSEGQKIYNNENLSARPFSGYKPRPMVFDILCMKNINSIIKNKNIEKIRKTIFISCLYEYYDIGLNLLIKSKKNNIFNEKEFKEIKKSIKFLHKKSMSIFLFRKENLMSRKYKLKKK